MIMLVQRVRKRWIINRNDIMAFQRTEKETHKYSAKPEQCGDIEPADCNSAVVKYRHYNPVQFNKVHYNDQYRSNYQKRFVVFTIAIQQEYKRY